jgi:hypothetical protein
MTVNCSYCTPDDGHGECPKHEEWSCYKTKILLLYLVGYLYTYVYVEKMYEPKKMYQCYHGWKYKTPFMPLNGLSALFRYKPKDSYFTIYIFAL